MMDKSSTAAKPKKKRKKVLIIVLVVAVIIAAVIWNVLHKAGEQVEMVNNLVEVEPVQKRDLSDTISLKGTVAGASRTNVTSKAVSEITEMNVQVGDIVKPGDVLCRLDSASIEEKIADLERSQSNANAIESINDRQAADAVQQAREDQERQLKEAQLAITQAEEGVTIAQRAYDANPGDETFPNLLNATRALESAKDNYNTTVDATNRAIENAQLQVQLNRYKDSDSSTNDTLKSLREQLEDCVVTAPCGGVVTAVNVRVGDINGDKVTILTIEDTSSLKVVATVAEADILQLQEGMSAVVTASATGEEEIKGTVSRVVRVKEQSMDGQTAGGYSVEIALDNSELLVGMEAKVRVMIQEKGEVLAIPYDLIRYDDNGDAYVLIAEGNSDGTATAVKKSVTLGDEVDYYTEVTGGELQEGDRMIYDYSGMIVEGQTFAPEQMYSEQDLGMTDGGIGGGASNVEVVE
ncbi:MAG: HlyD family efflux transporter periplasmic adaptor subunit [Roseburia sp.]|nr:HlyD family efflux transporter periplasmic adaptor subunit [Roseburia sp.]